MSYLLTLWWILWAFWTGHSEAVVPQPGDNLPVVECRDSFRPGDCGCWPPILP